MLSETMANDKQINNLVDNLVVLNSPQPTRSSNNLLGPFEAGTLVANTPVGVYRHHLRTVREKLRLEVAKSQQLAAELQLARDQLRAETGARVDMQVRFDFIHTYKHLVAFQASIHNNNLRCHTT